jgi:large subunit ribosomal protein L17
MKHRTGHPKLGRPSAQRRALLLSLARGLVQHERIQTTLPRAKALRPFVEKLITLGRRDTSGARQRLMSFISDASLRRKLTDDLAKRYQKRNGGYTRIMKTGHRFGDYAPMALIELVDRPEKKIQNKTEESA